MHITYSGQVSQKEYAVAIRIHFHRMFRWMKIAGGIFLVFLSIALVITIINQPQILSALFPGIVFPFIFLTFPWWIPLLQVSNYNNAANIYRAPVQGAIDDSGITINGQNTKVNFLWGAYTHFVKKGDLVLVYQNKNSFNIFTQSMFSSAADWEAFIRLLEEKTKPG